MTTTVRIPHNYQPRPYQLPFLKSKHRFKVAVWHRRSGKSKTALNEQVRQLIAKPGIYYYFLPTYRQAKAVVWDELIKQHIPGELVDKINDSELAIYWRNGSIQRFAGCEDIDKHRGINPIGVVFDEYSEISEQMWTGIIQPVIRENKGTVTFIFTPKGQNHAWKLVNQAKDDSVNWFVSVLSVEDTKAISDEELEKARKETPQALFNQEYLVEFTENAGAFFRRIKDNIWEADEHTDHIYQLGVDLAKYQDWTVLTPFCLTCFKALPQERFNQVDWNLQKARIEAVARRYNNAKIILDSTGVGDPIYEDLERAGLSILGFKFTENSRRQLLDNLSLKLEQDKIKIPNDEGLIFELQSMSMRLVQSDGGKSRIKVAVPEGSHDDRIMSLALSVWEAVAPVKQTSDEFNLYVDQY